MKLAKWLIIGVVIIVAIYLLGPRAQFDPLVSGKVALWTISLDSLDAYVKQKDTNIAGLKTDNESRIIWADSIRKTPYSIVYLHGFSASPMESDPTHLTVAKQLGCNLYMPLLAGHGLLDKESFLNLTPNDLVKSAKEALAIGQLIGDDVILMSCSTGGTLSIYLAGANPEMVDAMIMYSPNIAIANPGSKLSTGPWGEQIMNAVVGEYKLPKDPNDAYGWKYWTMEYRTEGLIALQKLLDETMNSEMFDKVDQPYFVGYYYKNEEYQDQTISTDAILDFHAQTSTPDDQAVLIAFPDAGEHVFTNPYKGKNVGAVIDSTLVFAESVLSLLPANNE